MAASAAAIALLPVLLLDGAGGAPAPQPPPWAMPPLAAQAVGGGRWAWPDASAGASGALIYVDRECVHCKAELARWESLAPEFDFGARVWVVASPGSEMDGATWLPASFRSRTVHDADGSAGVLLGVGAVPATFWIDATDTVRIVQVGQTGRRSLIDNIETIEQYGGGR